MSGGNWSDITFISIRRLISMLSVFSARTIDQVMGIVVDRCRCIEEGRRMVD